MLKPELYKHKVDAHLSSSILYALYFLQTIHARVPVLFYFSLLGVRCFSMRVRSRLGALFVGLGFSRTIVLYPLSGTYSVQQP